MAHVHGSTHGARGKLLLTLGITCTLMIGEAVGGWISGSLALVADAGHMLTDAMALVIAVMAMVIGARPSDAKRTYGYKRLEILAALVNGVMLTVMAGTIAFQAARRWSHPQPIDYTLMGTVAVVGLVANLIGLVLLKEHGHNLNVRGAFLHVLGDTLSSVGVVVGAAMIYLTGWVRIDALISCVIALVIVVTSLLLLRDVVDVLLESVPRGINADDVRQAIGAVTGVLGVHDLHIWSISSGMPALSAHVVVATEAQGHATVLSDIQSRLQNRFSIDHSTVQFETDVGSEVDNGCHGCP